MDQPDINENLTWPPQVRLFGARDAGALRVLIIQYSLQ
jgi:hypothetical protein